MKPTWQVIKHGETPSCLSPQVPTYVLSRYVNLPHKDIKNQIEIPPREQQLKIAFYRPFYSRASIISLLLRNHQIMSSFFLNKEEDTELFILVLFILLTAIVVSVPDVLRMA